MKKFCILEYPPKNNLSAIFYNRYFEVLNLDTVYDSLSCRPSVFDTYIDYVLKTYAGINITNPFKEKVLNHIKLDAIACDIGAVNCISDGVGYNTDYIGFLKSVNLAFLREPVLVIGYGGVAKTILYSLLKIGLKNIFVTNRTKKRLIDLQKRFPGVKTVDFSELNSNFKKFKTMINATSVGLKNESFNIKDLSSLSYLYDVIYYKTPLQSKAKTIGIPFTSGIKMWYYQAMENLKLWNLYNEVIFDKIFYKFIEEREE